MVDPDKANILIVDDLPQKLLVYETILEELGENLVMVRSGEDALKQVLKHDFAVILLDVNMPTMDGFETAQLIRQRRRSAHTPIIFLTAFADEFRTAQGYATGGVDYLPTPVVPEILRAKVRVFIDLYHLRRQVARQAEEQAKRAAAEESARRSAFLAEASRALTTSLDISTTVRQLLRVVVPALADLAAVTQVNVPDKAWRSEVAWQHPGSEQLEYQTIDFAQAPQDELRTCHDRVLATGNAEYLEGLAIPWPQQPSTEQIRSALVLPLVARGRALGALTLANASAERKLSADDITLAEDVASRAAIALDNAMLVRDIQDNDRRRNEFLAMLAHELRNPLAPIRNALEILRLMGPNQPEVSMARDVISRQLAHLVRLVDDLLDVSRITRGKIQLRPRLIDLRTVVENAVETSRPLIEAHAHEFDLSLPSDPLLVQADPARMAQVFSNLLNNAAKYTPEGGRVSVVVERNDGDAVVRVRDTGAGIPTEMLGKVFDLFTQVDHSLDRSQGGLGIGLTLVRRLVDMHEGNVQAFSAGEGQGSEFIVRLPERSATPDAHLLAAAEGTLEPVSSERYRVLVVDDNLDAARTLSLLLQTRQHDVRLAHDGHAALEAALEFRPEVVLLDIGLPGIDGYEVARRLRATPATREVLLVAVSGYGQDEDRKRSQEAGFDYHLVKPVDPAVLQNLFVGLRGIPGEIDLTTIS